MRKRRFFQLLIGVALLFGFAAVVFPRQREPQYKGKRLSDWVELYATPSRRSEADDAIRHIGTNALPFLLEWIGYEPGRLKLRLHRVVNAFLEEVDRGSVLRDAHESRADHALRAVFALGAEAEAAAFAEFSRLIKAPKSYGSAFRAADVFISFGRTCDMAAGLTNADAEVREMIARHFCTRGTNALCAVPALRVALNDPSKDVRAAATNALRKIDPKALEGARR